MRRFVLTFVLCLALLASGRACYSSATAPAFSGSMTTREHIASSPWWPTSTAAKQQDFVGTPTCTQCHASIAHEQATSQMAHTLGHAAQSAVLLQHLGRTYQSGPYVYSLEHDKSVVKVTVTAEGQTRSAALDWAFGSGQVGQSYLWLNPDGTFREARFNYFASVDAFEATPGRLHGAPANIGMALGRTVEGFEAKSCFSCHTTALTAGAALNETGFTPGVQCEACHGPGAQHVAAMKGNTPAGSSPDPHILNPARMSPAQSVDVCGSCHSTPWDVRLMGATGLQTVRFPAYRLEKSRCWGTSGDMRLVCQSCHDPHAPLERNPVAYDGVCLQCHAARPQRLAVSAPQSPPPVLHAGPVCPVAKTRCVTCHMQQYQLPEMHSNFTDHMIRVVRPNTPIPD